jgi:heme/copper-type cytochrome/quinol oxidase subunit 1
MTRRAGLSSRLVLAVGSALSIVGVVVLAVDSARPVSFGWFAYAPLSDTTFRAEGLHLFSTASLVGAGVLVIGLLVLSAWLGYRRVVHRRP